MSSGAVLLAALATVVLSFSTGWMVAELKYRKTAAAPKRWVVQQVVPTKYGRAYFAIKAFRSYGRAIDYALAKTRRGAFDHRVVDTGNSPQSEAGVS